MINKKPFLGIALACLFFIHSPAEAQQQPLTSASLTIQVLPQLNVQNQNKLRINPNLNVEFQDDLKVLAVKNVAGQVMAIQSLGSSYNAVKTNWSFVANSIANVVTSYTQNNVSVLNIDGEYSNQFKNDLIQSVAEYLNNTTTVESILDIMNVLRDDYVNIGAVINYDVIEQSLLNATSAQDVISDVFAVIAESRECHGEICVEATPLENGNPRSGVIKVTVYHSDYSEQKSFDIDRNNDGYHDEDHDQDGIVDSYEIDSRKDGDDTFEDAVMDFFYGDDGDGITAESEAGRMPLTASYLSQIYVYKSQSVLVKLATDFTRGQVTSLVQGQSVLDAQNQIIDLVNAMSKTAFANTFSGATPALEIHSVQLTHIQ